jgi:hypothetical protein
MIYSKLNFKFMKKIFLAVIVMSLLVTTVEAKYPVLARETSGGGLFGYAHVKSALATFIIGNVTTVGYDVDCAGKGFSSCPALGAQYRPTNPIDNWDATQVTYTDNLVNYALQQITQGNHTGSYSVNVQVQGEATMRVYQVEWNSADDDALDSNIIVNRDDVCFN